MIDEDWGLKNGCRKLGLFPFLPKKKGPAEPGPCRLCGSMFSRTTEAESFIFLAKLIAMKLFSLLMIGGLALSLSAQAQQDKSKRPSPPAKVTQKIASGATISIDYSQPSIKGRTIGTDLEPMEGKVWRMGANEATVFETDRDVTINGKTLPAGKYALYGKAENGNFTLIFNRKWNQWGTQYDQNKDQDALQVLAKRNDKADFQEQLSYTIDPKGMVTLHWGTMAIAFQVK